MENLKYKFNKKLIDAITKSGFNSLKMNFIDSSTVLRGISQLFEVPQNP